MGVIFAKLRKRSSDEAKKDDQTSELPMQEQDESTHIEVDSVSDKTLEDLPFELLECILVKVVAMEVKALKLAKRVWEEKADLVISRLRFVCLQWNNILTTISFRKKLQRTFDAAQEKKIRLEVLRETVIGEVQNVTTLKDDIFTFSRVDLPVEHSVIKVFDLNNMAEVKEVIPIPGPTQTAYALTGCSVSNCVYGVIECKNYLSVLRVHKDMENKFNVEPWEYDPRLPLATLSVCANGNLVGLSIRSRGGSHFAGIYNANGSLEHKRRIEFPADIKAVKYHTEVIQRSNGNLIMGIVNPGDETILLEIDMNGSIVRQYAASLEKLSFFHFADAYGRILITDSFKGMELFDPEFNLLGAYNLQQDEGKTLFTDDLHYERERNEILRVHYDTNADITVLTFFRFTEE